MDIWEKNVWTPSARNFCILPATSGIRVIWMQGLGGLLCHSAGENACWLISCRILVNVSSNLLFQTLKKCYSGHLSGHETLCIWNAWLRHLLKQIKAREFPSKKKNHFVDQNVSITIQWTNNNTRYNNSVITYFTSIVLLSLLSNKKKIWKRWCGSLCCFKVNASGLVREVNVKNTNLWAVSQNWLDENFCGCGLWTCILNKFQKWFGCIKNGCSFFPCDKTSSFLNSSLPLHSLSIRDIEWYIFW